MVQFKALLLDIEGTITSISFVKDELFPYAYNNVESFLNDNYEKPEVHQIIVDMIKDSMEECLHDKDFKVIRSHGKEECIQDVVHNVHLWIQKDKKITSLKALQGLIWEHAYTSGAVEGHLYPDVVPVLEKLSKELHIYIYSSGSVHAQKLLFRNSVAGDITPLLTDYFDTHVGPKQQADSYSAISHQLGKSPADVLFLTDVEAEARAAKAAGCHAILVDRPGNAALSDAAKRDFKVIHTLDEILSL